MTFSSLTVYYWAIAPESEREHITHDSRFSLATARQQGFQPQMLGVGHRMRHPERRQAIHQARFYVLDDVIQSSHADDDLLLIMDGYDTLFMPHASPHVLERRFNESGSILMFSAERDYTYQWLEYKAVFDQTTADYRYLASGTFIGRAWAIRQMAQTCIHDMNHGLEEGNDMGLLGKYAAEHPRRVALDYGRRIFWVTTRDQDLLLQQPLPCDALIVHVVGGRRELSPVYMQMYARVRTAHTRPPSFALAVRLEHGWLGPLSRSPKHSAGSIPLQIHDTTFYIPQDAVTTPDQPPFTAEVRAFAEL